MNGRAARPRCHAPAASVALGLVVLLLSAAPLGAGTWPDRPDSALAITPDDRNSTLIAACSDGAGGLLAAWAEQRDSNVPSQLRVARVDLHGIRRFLSLDLRDGSPSAMLMGVSPDGRGGAFAAVGHWRTSGSDVCVIRLDAAGNEVWRSPPTLARSTLGPTARLVTLGSPTGPHCLLQFLDLSTPMCARMQYLDGAGAPAWGDSGIVAWSFEWINTSLVADDGAGGAWLAAIGGTWTNGTIHVQRVHADGGFEWAPGTEVVLPVSSPGPPFCLSVDAAGGAWLSWRAALPTGGSWGFVQRVRPDGSLTFAPAGLPVPASPGDVGAIPSVCATADSQAFIAWGLGGAGNGRSLAQRLEVTGLWQWPLPAIRSTPDGYAGDAVGLFTDPQGGVSIATYPSWDTPAAPTELPLLVGQRLTRSGERLWGSAGATLAAVPIALAPIYYAQLTNYVQAVIGSQDGGVIGLVNDKRPGGGFAPYRIWAQHLDGWGRHGDTAPRVLALFDTAGDPGGWLTLRWRASSLQGDSAMATLAYELQRADGMGGWAPVASIPAGTDSEYVAQVPSVADSTGPESPTTVYRVRARDGAGRTWTSLSDSARSRADSPPLAVDSRTPDGFACAPPSPSPARGEVRLAFTLGREGHVSLTVFDVLGRRMSFRPEVSYPSGSHEVRLRLTDAEGRAWPPGLYLVRWEALDARRIERFVVLR